MGAKKGERHVNPYTLQRWILDKEPWMDKGVCHVEKVPSSVFILNRGQTSDRARTFCGRCAYRKECLDYGIKTSSVGIWGGEVLHYGHREEVILTPILILERRQTIVDLVKPDPLKDHQMPSFLFKETG